MPWPELWRAAPATEYGPGIDPLALNSADQHIVACGPLAEGARLPHPFVRNFFLGHVERCAEEDLRRFRAGDVASRLFDRRQNARQSRLRANRSRRCCPRSRRRRSARPS